MSVVLIIIGALVFAAGTFALYAGLVSAPAAEAVRNALAKWLADPKTVLIVAGAILAAAGFVIAVTGGAKARKERRGRAAVGIRVLTALAMLVAMTVMLDRFPGLSVKTPGWKIGFSFIPPMIAAVLYGPAAAALVYGLSDLIGALLIPFGPYHPGFTVVAALMGFVLGLFLNKRPFAFAGGKAEWKKIRFFPNCIVPVAVNCLLLGLVVNTLWVSQLYGSRTYGGWFVYRLVEYAILVPVQLVLLPAILKLCERLKRTGLVKNDRRSEARLASISRNESILGLQRVSRLLSLMGDPQNAVPTVHVAGTNGKGSFSALLSSVLREAGLKVGAFNSPALTGPCDSFRINGERITDRELDSLLGRIGEYTAKMSEKPTEFEVMTAAAFEYFRSSGCDIAIVECGLGGADDATNVIARPLLSVITNVDLDHTARLGATTEAIARKKAGIIKPSRPVLWGGSDASASAVIAEKARECGSALYRTDLDRLSVISESVDGAEFDFDGFGRIRLSLLGAYQPENAASVLTAVEILRSLGINIPDAAVLRGMETAVWPARFELLRREPAVVYDGAHNPAGMALAVESVKRVFPGEKPVFLIGVMADKDRSDYPEMLKSISSKIFCVKPDGDRSLDAETLCAEFLSAGADAEAFTSFDEGVSAAYAAAAELRVPLVALGTLYMYPQFTAALAEL